MKQKTKILSKYLSRQSSEKKDFFLFALAAFIYFIFVWSKGRIANYPSELSYLTFTLSILTISIIQRDKLLNLLKKVKDIDSFLSLLFESVGKLIFALFISCVVLIPFNFTNIYLSKQNDIRYINCKITGVSTYSQNRTIFYELNGESNVIYTYEPIMQEIKNARNYAGYTFVAKVREGFFGSYILEGWDIERKAL